MVEPRLKILSQYPARREKSQSDRDREQFTIPQLARGRAWSKPRLKIMSQYPERGTESQWASILRGDERVSGRESARARESDRDVEQLAGVPGRTGYRGTSPIRNTPLL